MRDDGNPYLLLTPGPASTSPAVRAAMLRDYCTWDEEYHAIVRRLRADLVALVAQEPAYTTVLMQGSGTFCVEATVTSVVPAAGRLLVAENGAYGQRITRLARQAGIDTAALAGDELRPVDPERVDAALREDPRISHVALVHCETTTGLLNPLADIAQVVAAHGRRLMVDAMSSFGGIPLRVEALPASYVVSSASKCLQGVPGFGFVVAERSAIEATAGWARSYSLDLYDQWREMEQHGGKWRFTSPTHVVRALAEALAELAAEGGVEARHARYRANQRRLAEGMAALGYQPLLPAEWQSPIITAFPYPRAGFDFARFYRALRQRGFVIYPGKVSRAETFRIGTIGQVFADDIERLLEAVAQVG